MIQLGIDFIQNIIIWKSISPVSWSDNAYHGVALVEPINAKSDWTTSNICEKHILA